MALDCGESNCVVVVVTPAAVDDDSLVTTVDDDVECALDADGEPFRFIVVMAAAIDISLLTIQLLFSISV